MKFFYCLHLLNQKQDSQDTESTAEKISQTQLRYKNRRSTPSEDGKCTSKSPLVTCNYTCSSTSIYLVASNQMQDSLTKPPKHSNKKNLEPNLLSPKTNQIWMSMCTIQLTEPKGGARQTTNDNPKTPRHYIVEIKATEKIKQNWFQQSHETSPQGKHNINLLQYQLMCLNNKQKMSWLPKTYKHYSNPLKHPKLTRVNVLIFVHLETGNKVLKSGKDKNHNKSYQDGLTRDNFPSKPDMQSIHFKKHASLQTFVNSHYIASKPKSKQNKH